jgi:hypothetical protein
MRALQPVWKDFTMKQLLILAGVAALAATAPAYAKPGNGNGNGNGHGNGHGNGYGYDNNNGYGQGHCPPGLAKKGNGCMPPGQYRKLYSQGQRIRSSFGQRYSYNQLPYSIRQQYNLDRSNRYYYDNGYLYQVDPRTMVVENVIQTLLGRR